MIRTITNTIITAVLITISVTINAQFVTPLSTISGDSELITVDGKTASGKLKNAMMGPNGLMSFKFEDAEGNKVKYKANEVEQLKIKVDGLAKLEIIAEQSSNITKLANSNFKEVVDREYIYWERVKDPNKDRYYLLQLLNPGFDQLIKVYDLPNDKSGETSVGGVGVSGGVATAYLVVVNGKSMKITKKKYKKQDFDLLFGNCPKVIEECKPDFKNFAAHVFLNNEVCGK